MKCPEFQVAICDISVSELDFGDVGHSLPLSILVWMYFLFRSDLAVEKIHVSTGGSRGRHQRTPPKGRNSFVLTYKFFEM